MSTNLAIIFEVRGITLGKIFEVKEALEDRLQTLMLILKRHSILPVFLKFVGNILSCLSEHPLLNSTVSWSIYLFSPPAFC